MTAGKHRLHFGSSSCSSLVDDVRCRPTQCSIHAGASTTQDASIGSEADHSDHIQPSVQRVVAGEGPAEAPAISCTWVTEPEVGEIDVRDLVEEAVPQSIIPDGEDYCCFADHCVAEPAVSPGSS